MSQVSTVQSSPAAAQSGRCSVRRAIQRVVLAALWLGLLFAGAGRLDWLRGWMCIAIFVITRVAVGAITRHYNPSLAEARRTLLHKDAKRSDRILVMILLPLLYCLPLIAGLDAVRFRWSSVPLVFAYVGVFLFVLAMLVITWASSVNPFAESTVRIQTERGHHVITSGPYHVIRHPLYAAAIVMFPAISLILGSLWALALTGLIAVVFIVRTAMEDRTLRHELPGYEEYATHTRYRLLPGVW